MTFALLSRHPIRNQIEKETARTAALCSRSVVEGTGGIVMEIQTAKRPSWRSPDQRATLNTEDQRISRNPAASHTASMCRMSS